jgi:hypothetical protein
MAGLSAWHHQRESLRLTLLKGSNNRAISGSMALLSQSRAAYRNSERRDDCNSRNPEIIIMKSPFNWDLSSSCTYYLQS